MFLIIAAILDKLYLAPDIQILVITILIVAVFGIIVGGILAVPYFGRGDNYLEVHVAQRDEPIDLPFHGGRNPETPLNYDPNNREDLQKIERGELIPRHDIGLNLTEEKDFRDLFPEVGRLGFSRVTVVHLRYHLHFRERFDLSTGAEVVRKGVPFYHPHAEEVWAIPVGTDYYGGVPNPVFEVCFTRKGDYEMLSNPDVMDVAIQTFVKSQLNTEEQEAAAPQSPTKTREPGGPGDTRLAKH